MIKMIWIHSGYFCCCIFQIDFCCLHCLHFSNYFACRLDLRRSAQSDIRATSFNLPTMYSARPKHKEMKGIKSMTLLKIVSSQASQQNLLWCSTWSRKLWLSSIKLEIFEQTALVSHFSSMLYMLTGPDSHPSEGEPPAKDAPMFYLLHPHHSTSQLPPPQKKHPGIQPTFRASCPKRMAVKGSKLVVVTNWPTKRAMMDPSTRKDGWLPNLLLQCDVKDIETRKDWCLHACIQTMPLRCHSTSHKIPIL